MKHAFLSRALAQMRGPPKSQRAIAFAAAPPWKSWTVTNAKPDAHNQRHFRATRKETALEKVWSLPGTYASTRERRPQNRRPRQVPLTGDRLSRVSAASVFRGKAGPGIGLACLGPAKRLRACGRDNERFFFLEDHAKSSSLSEIIEVSTLWNFHIGGLCRS